jgi:DNA-binding response OmpR family regulator
MPVEFGWAMVADSDRPFIPSESPEWRTERSVTAAEAPIVLVEDNTGDVELIRYALDGAGVNRCLRIFADGDQAIRFIDELDHGRGICPVAFVLDLNLPRTSGHEVLLRIRRSPVCGKAPVMIFSSSAAEVDRAEAVRLGADRYVVKPSDLDEFLQIGWVVRDVMERR